jgi:hypothetical protein
MNIRYAFAFVFLITGIACDKKEGSESTSESASRSDESAYQKKQEASQESVGRNVPTARQVCVPSIQGMSPQEVPAALRVYCDTKEPLDPVAFRNYMQRVQNAAAEAQQEIAARQQAMQATGDPRLAGIQQQQDGCEYRYPGVFPQDGPMAGMCANSQAEIDRYLRDQGMAQEARDNREIEQINANAASQCRRMCITANNPALCRAGCPSG